MGLQIFSYLGNIVMVVNLGGDDEITRLTDDCDRFCKWADRFLAQLLLLESVRCAMKYQIFVFPYEGAVGSTFVSCYLRIRLFYQYCSILHRRGRDFPCSQMILI